MEYNIKKTSAISRIISKFQSQAEDKYLSFLLTLLKYFPSEKLAAYIEELAKKRIQKMQSEIIRMRWDKITLEKATASMKNQAAEQKHL